MDKIELKEKIDIILNDELSTRKSGRFTKHYSGKQRFDNGSMIDFIGDKIQTVFLDIYEEYREFPRNLPDTKNIELHYPNLELLLKLYESIRHSPEHSNYFIDYLFNFRDKKYVCFLTNEALIKLNNLERLFRIINFFDNPNLKHFFMVLDELLFFEYTLFTENQLKQIKKQVNTQFNIRFPKSSDRKSNKQLCGIGESILRRINLILYNALSQSLNEGTNFQINIDRKKIKKMLDVFGFDPVLSETIDKLEELYWDTSADKFDFSMAIATLRTFSEKLLKSICNEINKKTKEKIPKTKENESEMKKHRNYLKKHLELDEEDKLINVLVEIFNHKGSHTLISEREYFRLTKNIFYEIAFLILIKLEKLIEK